MADVNNNNSECKTVKSKKKDGNKKGGVELTSVRALEASELVSAPVSQWSTLKTTRSPRSMLKKTRIDPAFERVDTRVVVQVTHFNKKKFNGFVTLDDAKHQIFQAIGMELSNHHGTSFERAEEDNVLFITFKLKRPISKDQLNRFFWYLKESRSGVDGLISGEVVYPKFKDTAYMTDRDTKDSVSSPNSGVSLRISGCDYKLSEKQIRSWIEIYGKIQGEIEEEALVDEIYGSDMGTGAFVAMVNLKKRILGTLPMLGQKVTIKCDGGWKICKKCYEYHKETTNCEKRSWQEYVDQFMDENPGLPRDWFEYQPEKEDDSYDEFNRSQNCDANTNSQNQDDVQVEQDEQVERGVNRDDQENNQDDDDAIGTFLAGNISEGEKEWMIKQKPDTDTAVRNAIRHLIATREGKEQVLWSN